MEKTFLVFGAAAQLPESAGQARFESLYQASYKPFLSFLYRNKDVQAALFHSGPVLAWLEEKHPEYMILLEELASRKQVEFLGGGYHNPVFSMIPPADRLGQVEALTTRVRKRFGRKPRGCWLPASAWDSSYPALMQACGMDYTFLPECHFEAAGAASLHAPWLTEDQGKAVTVLPLHERLAERLPKMSPEEAIAAMKVAGKGGVVAIMLDLQSPAVAGGEQWIGKLIAALAASQESVETAAPSKLLKAMKPGGKAYFPSILGEKAALAALGEEARADFLHAKESLRSRKGQDRFLRGGSFRDFLTLRPEAGHLYAKMQYVQALVAQMRGDKSRKKAAREELWKAQASDCYWGPDGQGLYCPRVRDGAFAALIEAEKAGREKGVFAPSLQALDFDFDGEKEYLFQGSAYNAYVQGKGAAVFELDHLASSRNYANAMSPAPYCGRLFHDRIYPSGAPGQPMLDFSAASFNLESFDKARQEMSFSCEARAQAGKTQASFVLRKRFTFRRDGFSVSYELSGDLIAEASLVFSTELNLLACVAGSALDRIKADGGVLAGEGAHRNYASISCQQAYVRDEEKKVKLRLSSDQPFSLLARGLALPPAAGAEDHVPEQGIAVEAKASFVLLPGLSWSRSFALDFN